MEFQLMNAEIYTGFTDEKDVEEILARLNPTNFKNRIRVDNAIVSGWEVKRIFIEIRTMEELKELYKIFGCELILNFDEKYPHIAIYDGYIEQKGLSNGKNVSRWFSKRL